MLISIVCLLSLLSDFCFQMPPGTYTALPPKLYAKVVERPGSGSYPAVKSSKNMTSLIQDAVRRSVIIKHRETRIVTAILGAAPTEVTQHRRNADIGGITI